MITRKHFEAGLLALEDGDLQSAQGSFKLAYSLEPLRPSIVQNFLEVSYRLRDIETIKSVCLDVLSKVGTRPDMPPLLLITPLKALVLSGLPGHARSVLSEVSATNSFDHRSLVDLVEVSIAAGDARAARRFFSELEGMDPTDADLNRLSGRILFLEGDYTGAIAKLTELPPESIGSADNTHDLALCYAALRRYQEAYTKFVQCLNLGGGRRKKELLVSLANVSRKLGIADTALNYLDQARQLAPTDLGLRSEYIYRSLISGYWDNLPDFPTQHETSPSLTDSDPLTLLSHLDHPETIHRMASFHAALDSRSIQIPPFRNPARGNTSGKLRVGFISSDFRHHAVGYLLRTFFRHASEQEECIGIDLSPYAPDEITRYISATCSEFHSISKLDDRTAFTHLRDLSLDVAIDLNGYTEHGRPWLFYSRIAPIQVNYLGYPGTMGHPSYDFIVGDEIVIPREHEPYYSEKVLRLESCYQINDDLRWAPSPITPSGLPSGRFVFACFHNNFKINPSVFSVWMEILKRCPDSILWLLSGSGSFNENIHRRAETAGIDPNRVVLAPRAPLNQHISRHLHADLFLDTWPYGGHTSVSDVIWSGRPVIAMCGASFASRVSASILCDADLSALVTDSTNGYVEKAVSLYNNNQQLANFSARAALGAKSPLFDTAQKASNFFKLLHQVASQR